MAKLAYLYSKCGIKSDLNNGLMENSVFYCGFSPNYNNIQSAAFTTSGSTDTVTLTFANEDNGLKIEMPAQGPSTYSQKWTNYVKSANGVGVIPVYLALHTYINNDHYANQALAMAWMIKDAGRIKTKEFGTGASVDCYSRSHYGGYGEWNTCCLRTGTTEGNHVLSNAMNGLRKHAYHTKGTVDNDDWWCSAMVGDSTSGGYITSPTQWSTRNDVYIHCTGSYNYGGGYVSLNSIHFTTKGDTTGLTNVSVWIPRSSGELATEIPLSTGIYDSTNGITHYFAYFYNNVVTSSNDYAYSGGTPNGTETAGSSYGLSSERGFGYDSPLNIPVSKINSKITPISNSTVTQCSQSGLGFGTSRYISSFTTSFNMYITNSGSNTEGIVIGGIECVLVDYTWAYSYVYSHIWHYGHMVYDEHSKVKTPVFYSLLFLQHICSDNNMRTGDSYGYGWNVLYPNMSVGQISSMDNTINGYLSVTKTLGGFISGQSGDEYPTLTGKYGINNITLIKSSGNISSPYTVGDNSWNTSVIGCRRFNTLRFSNFNNRNIENYKSFSAASSFLSGLNRGLYLGLNEGLSNTTHYLDGNSSLYGTESGSSARIGNMKVIAVLDVDTSTVNINGVPLKYLTSNFPMESMSKDNPNVIKFKLNYILTTAGGAITNNTPKFKPKVVEIYDNDLKNAMVGNEKKIYLPIERNSSFNHFNAELRLPLVQINENFSSSTSTNAFTGPEIYSYNYTSNKCTDKLGNEYNDVDVNGVKFNITFGSSTISQTSYNGAFYTTATYPVTLKIWNDSSTFGLFDLAIGAADATQENDDDKYWVPKETAILSDLLSKILIKGDASKISNEVIFNESEYETTTNVTLRKILCSSNDESNEITAAINANSSTASPMLPSSGSIMLLSMESDTSPAIKGEEDGVMNVGEGISGEETEVPIDSENICIIDRCTGEVIGVGANVKYVNSDGQETPVGASGMAALKGRCINKNFLPLLSTVIKVY